uniref:Ubiquitin-like domain-containing protein n=1 Tax=Amphiprion ocellaris TaxID=80972 RepID=A0AAQ6A3H6_AMPOC
MGKIYQVVVIGLRAEKVVIDLCDTEEQFKTITVLQLKEKILSKLACNIRPDDFRLIFTYKNLEGDATLLCDYGIEHKSTIQMVLWLGGGGFPEKEDGGMGDKDKNRT